MRSRLNKLLILSLLFVPVVVFASNGKNEFTFWEAIIMEAFVTIHMSIFVLKPLSGLISKEDSNKTFWCLFMIRIGVLLFFDIFITTSIAFVDFFAVFIGAFSILPISIIINSKKKIKNNQIPRTNITKQVRTEQIKKENINLNCSKCNSLLQITDNFCSVCGEPFNKNNITILEKESSIIENSKKIAVLPSNFDKIYSLPEDKLLEEFINKEFVKCGIDKSINLIPSAILKRKKILNIIFSVLVFVFISLIFFHFPIYTYIIGSIILFIFYKVTRKYSLIKYLKREIMARPGEKITNIIMNTKNTFVADDTKGLFIICLMVAIVLPFIIFVKPRILYEKVDNGYAVRYYIFGLTNFKTVNIPEIYKNEKVVSLRGNTFSNMPLLKSVSLPDTITEIRGQAFKNCRSLTKVNIPKKLEYLGGGAFYNAKSIKKIELPDSLTYLGGESFYGAKSLEYIKLSNNLTEIRGNSFEYCTSLKSIAIPNSVTRIGGHAFYGASSLSSVIIGKDSKLAEIGSSAFRQCSSLYNITIPSNTYVNSRAFKESPTSISRPQKEYYNSNSNLSNNYSFTFKEHNNMSISVNVSERKVINNYNTSTGTALIKYNDVNYLFNYDNTNLSGTANNHFIIDNLYISFYATLHYAKESIYFKNNDFEIKIRDINDVPSSSFYNLNYKHHTFYKLQEHNSVYIRTSAKNVLEMKLNDILTDKETGIRTYKFSIGNNNYEVKNTDNTYKKIDDYCIQFMGLYDSTLDIKIHYN